VNDRAGLVTPIVRRKAEALGDLGEAWLAGLGDLITDLEERWSVRVEQPLSGGTSAYVARARTPAGRWQRRRRAGDLGRGFLERASTGLYALSLGADELGQPHLDTAERLI
jgi:hypothetical protein